MEYERRLDKRGEIPEYALRQDTFWGTSRSSGMTRQQKGHACQRGGANNTRGGVDELKKGKGLENKVEVKQKEKEERVKVVASIDKERSKMAT